ncbi:MAG: GAF domain-containing protein, partial [bacterium]|nr:GAF domain-containing protein [Candidatus Kapabacteria bacterium]
ATLVVRSGLTAYLHIARFFYNLPIEHGYPIVVQSTEKSSGLQRHYKVVFETRFAEIRLIGELPPLTDAQKEHIIANVTDMAMWRAMIPPESFEMHGFTVAVATDVTDQEEAGALKRDLIDSDAITSRSGFALLQQRVRNLLKLPELILGLAVHDGDRVLLVNHGAFDEREFADCIVGASLRYQLSDFNGTYLQRSSTTGQAVVIHDLETYPDAKNIELMPLEQGYRNVASIPLMFEDRPIGALALWARKPGDITDLTILRLAEMLPLFSIAIRRSHADLNNRVQQIIREEYTSIHPAVEWRFRKSAMRILESSERGETVAVEPIVFENVFPLYSQSDIRGSSTQRNAAIQADLTKQLHVGRSVIEAADAVRGLPILQNVMHRIDRFLQELEKGLGSGDEAAMLDFLRRDVESLFDHIGDYSPDVVERIEAYRNAIDSTHGFIYERRMAFEESVSMINRAIAAYVDEQENLAQGMYPHFFEKHQTDGIDLSIYIGESLVANREYHPIYLKNLRLWQLTLMCSLARLSDALQPQLPVPLETTHLVLAQHSSLSIRFRTDEKQFDVDGAYNIRYEILKKRIDKATVRGTGERLTQPGKVAIVYSQPREAIEYREYIEYLQSCGLLTESLEVIELDELQGVQGLRAIRVTVIPAANEDAVIDRIVSAAAVAGTWPGGRSAIAPDGSVVAAA